MSLRRTIVTERLRTILLNKTDAGSRVWRNLGESVWREELPAIVIYSRSENIELFNQAPREYKRELEVSIEIMAEGPDEPNDADGVLLQNKLDILAEQVELEINRDDTLGKYTDGNGQECLVAEETVLNNVEFEFIPGDQPSGAIKLIYMITYIETRPSSLEEQMTVQDLNQIIAQWDIEGGTDEIEATDEIDLPQ